MISTFALMAAAAAVPAMPSAESTKPLTLQEQFDTASDYGLRGHCAEAVSIFEAVEADPAYKAASLSAAMIAVRKGQCLIRIGRTEEGEVSIRKGLPKLGTRGDQFAVDITSARLSLGDAAMSRWDYVAARSAYEAAQAIPNGTNPVVINLKLAQATMFDGGEAPLRYIDAAIKGAEATPGLTREKLAEYRTMRGRILLNQGRHDEAYAELKEALKLTGRLDRNVNSADVIMRSDLALAAKLAGDDTNARKYLAYTGAGRIGGASFQPGVSMQPPVCGSETGLRPEDFAVVDFAIGANGEVIAAKTTYTPGSAEVAAQFARAVREWAWNPEAIAKIPAFYLANSRVELRCTTMGQETPGLMTPLSDRFVAWAAPQLGLGNGVDRNALKKALGSPSADAIATTDPVRTAARLGMRAMLMMHDRAERYGLVKSALAAGGAIPAEARNTLEVMLMAFRVLDNGRSKLVPPARAAQLLALADSPGIAADPLAADTARLYAAEPFFRKRDRIENETDVLQQVARDTRLPDHHPLRQVAHLRLADAAARKGDFASAQAHFTATGLSEEQCALLGVTPAIRSTGISSADFPDTALAWGFEGWVQLEFDIASDGKTVGARPLVAYPPFIFSNAATRSAQDFSFQSSFRPNGGAACAAQRQSLTYKMR